MTSVPEPLNVIYGLSCSCHPEDGVRYVGQTSVGIDRRLAAHATVANARQGVKMRRHAVHAWMRKHGTSNIVATLLEAVERPEDLDDAEIAWIEQLGTHKVASSARGLNLTGGGRGVRGHTFTAEARLSLANSRQGESHPRALLSNEQVEEIKVRLWEGTDGPTLAERYNVSRSVILNIGRGASWVYVPWPIGPRRRPGEAASSDYRKGAANKQSRLTADDVRIIRQRRAAGELAKTIARDYPVCYTTVLRIGRREAWAHVE